MPVNVQFLLSYSPQSHGKIICYVVSFSFRFHGEKSVILVYILYQEEVLAARDCYQSCKYCFANGRRERKCVNSGPPCAFG